MIENYVTLSLETHLFFARIMKEHALFLEAGFPCMESEWIEKGDWLRKNFEELLDEAVKLSNGRVNAPILGSGELVTEFTINAEKRTECLTGVPINTAISKMEERLRAGTVRENSREIFCKVHRINERSLRLLAELIRFKENILKAVKAGNLFTFNYPLLIEHILREARLYCSTIEQLMSNRRISYRLLLGTENFWNRIMMEHACFIRGLLDPTEGELIGAAHGFAKDYRELLEMAEKQDCKARELAEKSLEETLKYREFKAAGARGILNCEIASLILPLLADHVLREANHYIRILNVE